MWFMWLNWRKSIFYPVTAPNDSKCWHIVTSSIQEPVASNCDVTMTDCSRVVAMDAFLAYFVNPVFQHGASLVLLIGPLGTNFSEILIEILTFSFKKIRLKVSSAKRWPFCLGLNVLNKTLCFSILHTTTMWSVALFIPLGAACFYWNMNQNKTVCTYGNPVVNEMTAILSRFESDKVMIPLIRKRNILLYAKSDIFHPDYSYV